MCASKMSYSVGSLFAGVGGICQAFKNAGCEVVWANEIDDDARATYQLNHQQTYLLEEKDVCKVNKKNAKEVDILTAGFPCQPFSLAGHREGFKDERGQLFYQIPRLLKELRPRAYLLENVKNLSTHNQGESFRIVKRSLLKAGYSFIPFILNAAQYTTIPQGRERLYIVGFLGESDYFYDHPVLVNENENAENCPFSRSFKIPQKRRGKRWNIQDFLENSVPDKFYYMDMESHIHVKIQKAVTRTDTVYQYQRFYVRENKSDLCPTLTASMGGGGHNVPIVLDKNRNIPRKLTPKECFNFQGFPGKFKLPKGILQSKLYRQAGNSVVVPMVEEIAKKMIKVLDENS